MRQSVRYGSTVTVALLVAAVLFSRIAIAQDGTGTVDHCEGLAPGAGWICEGFFGILEWFVTTLQALVRGMFGAVVEFILTTPAPYADGERALLGRPDNPPWPALYDLYLMQILPIGLALWALVVLLVQFTRLFTVNVADEYRRTRLTRRAAFAILFLIAWWPVGAFTLHLADALTLTIAPTGEQMLSTVSEFQANVGGGILIAVLVYLSAGVVAFLLVMLFLARYVVIFTFMPMMPLVIALGIIDEGPFKPLAGVAKSVGNLFVPFVFMTLPSAAILLVGYTIQDALRESLGSISVLVAVAGGDVGVRADSVRVLGAGAVGADLCDHRLPRRLSARVSRSGLHRWQISLHGTTASRQGGEVRALELEQEPLPPDVGVLPRAQRAVLQAG